MRSRQLLPALYSMFALVGGIACITKKEARIPPEFVMHFPFTMAINKSGQTLAVSASSADGKYDFGRLVTLDLKSVKSEIDSGKSPLPWDKVVKTNVLIPTEIGELSFSDSFLAFASRETNRLTALPVKAGVSSCNNPSLRAEDCEGASTIDLTEEDPYALKSIQENAALEMLLVSYLSSDRIDLIKIDKSKQKDALVLANNFRAIDWLGLKIAKKNLKDYRLITKKIQVTFKNDPGRSKAYFLLEQHLRKIATPTRPKASYIVAVKVSDLITPGISLSDSMVEVINLSDLFSIGGVQDFFVDEDQNEAIVLGRAPEALYKVDLNQKTLLEMNVVCTGATTMAVSKDFAVIPCLKDNLLASFSRSSLKLAGSSQVVGRAPSYVVIDEKNSLIYCSFNADGTVGIFDQNLKYLGNVFEKAPKNRMGS